VDILERQSTAIYCADVLVTSNIRSDNYVDVELMTVSIAFTRV